MGHDWTQEYHESGSICLNPGAVQVLWRNKMSSEAPLLGQPPSCMVTCTTLWHTGSWGGEPTTIHPMKERRGLTHVCCSEVSWCSWWRTYMNLFIICYHLTAEMTDITFTLERRNEHTHLNSSHYLILPVTEFDKNRSLLPCFVHLFIVLFRSILASY